MWKSAFRQNYRTFLAHNSTFHHWVLSRGDARRCLVAKVGTSNQGHTISLKAAVRSCINKLEMVAERTRESQTYRAERKVYPWQGCVGVVTVS